MSRRQIQFHPDSTDSEEKSFVLIGINLFFGLAALLLVFILLGQKQYGLFEVIGVVVVVAIPVFTSYIFLKGDKKSLAYDRASQIVNYTDSVNLVLKNIEDLSTLAVGSPIESDSAVEICRVTLKNGPNELSCLVKKDSSNMVPEIEATEMLVEAFIDPTSKEVVAFSIEDKMVWAIPKAVVDKNFITKQ